MFKRNKLFILGLMVVMSSFLVVGNVLADATQTSTQNARRGAGGQGINYNVTVADNSNGYTMNIDSAGAASVMEYPKTIAVDSDNLGEGVALVSSACRVSNIIVSGTASSAGDYVLLYDAASATGTPKFDITIGTAKETVAITIPGGATFATGVFAQQGSGDFLHLTITYDN